MTRSIFRHQRLIIIFYVFAVHEHKYADKLETISKHCQDITKPLQIITKRYQTLPNIAKTSQTSLPNTQGSASMVELGRHFCSLSIECHGSQQKCSLTTSWIWFNRAFPLVHLINICKRYRQLNFGFIVLIHCHF